MTTHLRDARSLELTDASHACVCAADGYCPKFRREMHGNFRRVCQGAPGIAEDVRAQHLATWEAEADEDAKRVSRSKDRARQCLHLGPALVVDGEPAMRDCPTCAGTVRLKLFACAVHDECTIKQCQTCRDHRAEPDEPGGLGEGHHEHDHWALSFTKSGKMGLYNFEDNEDTTFSVRFPDPTWFFLGGGPSLRSVDLEALRGRNTFAVNGVCEVYPRPSAWCATDPFHAMPGDPMGQEGTLKLLPRAFAGDLDPSDDARFFLRNTRFNPWTFLSERTVNWGSERRATDELERDAPWGRGRSVMLAALKLMWFLGARRIVLLGVDWHMDAAQPYAHSATADDRKASSNNDKFGLLSRRFGQLRPVFEAAGLTVVNATEGSRLEVFEKVNLREELARADAERGRIEDVMPHRSLSGVLT